MKNLFLILSMALVVSCCAPASNPDDNIDSYSGKEEVVEQPKMATVTLYYKDGTTKVIEHEWGKTYNYDNYVKFYYEESETVFEHHGEYDITYDR